jgi:hypothetical protein
MSDKIKTDFEHEQSSYSRINKAYSIIILIVLHRIFEVSAPFLAHTFSQILSPWLGG